MKLLKTTLIAAALFSATAVTAQAGVVIGGTRVIYDGAKKEASLSVSNPDKVPYLIQSWIESPAGGAEKSPFVITPPLYRLNYNEQNNMRIVLTGNLPQTKESMYWLNVKAIPSAPKKDNTLQIAVKTKIKLIYRPDALRNVDTEALTDKLTWQRVGNDIRVTNPTNYYMNFSEIKVGGKALDDASYVSPGSSATFNATGTQGQITFRVISDYGAPGATHQAKM